MNITLIIKSLIGAAIVVIIQLIASTKNYFVAALVPLFPFFGLISYYIVGTQRGVNDLKDTVLFGMFSLIPYLAFLVSLYFAVNYYKVQYSLVIASLTWLIIAAVLVIVWKIFGIHV